ncbi:hypothetical protein JW935_26220 [candidate division KSB1 bacterium]|nr:hypothetical protein [candidate division KSB1 bacterium]
MSEPKKSRLDRFLNIFTRVHPGEGIAAILLSLNIFLLLTAYYIIKPVREALILAGGGAEIKSYAAAGQAILLLGAVPLYSWLASRIPRRQLINRVTLFFALCLALFYILALLYVPLGVIFYLWVGIFNLMVPAQFWAFSNEIYTTEAGKRIFVIIAFGASLGAVFGSWINGILVEPLGVYQLLIVSGVLLVFSLAITNIVALKNRGFTPKQWLESRTFKNLYTVFNMLLYITLFCFIAFVQNMNGIAFFLILVVFGFLLFLRYSLTGLFSMQIQQEETQKADRFSDAPLKKGGAFRLLFRSRYLLLIAFLMLILNWVNTTGEYILGKTVVHAAEKRTAELAQLPGMEKQQLDTFKKQFIDKFYADFFFYVNIAGLLLQMFVVSRILTWFGIRVAILILPLLALCGYAVIAFVPMLAIIRWVKTAENSTDYSLQNTVRQVLFLPTTPEQKYKAKQAIDTFFVRAGDVLTGLLVLVGTTVFSIGIKQFAYFNMGLVFIWLVIAWLIGKENKKLVKAEINH